MHFTRESIFVASLRALCISIAVILGIMLTFISIYSGLAFLTPAQTNPAATTMVYAPDANGKRHLLSFTSPVVLRIDFHGVIGLNDLTYNAVSGMLLDSQDGLLTGRVKAILLHMNTPGGTVTDSDDIYRALLDYKEKYKVPIYAYVDGMCASGGMYIASAADKILSAPSSVIGSVGVILGPMFNVSDAMEKIGVQAATLTAGKDKDTFNPFRPWKENEGESVREITSDLYQRFVDIVTKARPAISRDMLIDDYGAHVFVAPKAVELGYADDASSSYGSALCDLVMAAGITDSYQVVQLTYSHPLLESLTSQNKSPLITGKMTHRFDFGQGLSPELSGKFLYMYTPTHE